MGALAFETKIEIDDPDRLYTSGDVISGTLTVQVRRDASLQAIEVGVRCLVDAHVQIDKAHFHEKDRMYSENYRVFPDKEIEDSMSEFTIGAGDYEYPFQLTLPTNPLLPQTFDKRGSMSGVYWYVKARVVHSGTVPNNMAWIMPSALSFSGTSFWGMAKQKFKFAPVAAGIDPKSLTLFDVAKILKPPTQEAPSRFMARFQSKYKLPVCTDLQLSWPDKGLAQAPSPIHLGLRIQVSEVNALEVAEIKVKLRSHTRIYVHHRVLCNSKFPNTYDLFTLHPHLVLDSKETDLSRLFKDKTIEKQLVGTIDVPNIHHWYELKLDITFTSPHHPSFRKTVNITRKMVDLAPAQVQLPSYDSSTKALPAQSTGVSTQETGVSNDGTLDTGISTRYTADTSIADTSMADTPPPADHGYTPMDSSNTGTTDAPPTVDFDAEHRLGHNGLEPYSSASQLDPPSIKGPQYASDFVNSRP